jgi:hypothetical protein
MNTFDAKAVALVALFERHFGIKVPDATREALLVDAKRVLLATVDEIEKSKAYHLEVISRTLMMLMGMLGVYASTGQLTSDQIDKMMGAFSQDHKAPTP